jgi:hypothetical protein
MIHKVRCGAATNSSSSHSVIVMLGGEKLRQGGAFADHYGWEDFTLTTPEAKLDYLEKQWAIGSGQLKEDDYGGIDHQSVWDWPKDIRTHQASEAFYRYLREEIIKPEVVVLGGNDNSEGHPEREAGVTWEPYEMVHYASAVCREDPKGWVTILSQSRWGKSFPMKVRFGGGDASKSTTPELMDIKISDFCPFGCTFCYQGSTGKGKHASEANLRRVATALQHMGVMEVAIGGGEPTLHPKFDWFVEHLSKRGIMCNVTTKNKKWVDKFDPWTQKGITRVGYSITSPEEVKKQHWLVNHVVLGTVDGNALRQILVDSDATLLLAFKETGFGKGHTQIPCDDWMDQVAAAKGLRILSMKEKDKTWSLGIDTPLAAKYHKQLLERGISPLLFETEEGKHSAYVDAVSMEFGPCSYAPGKMVKIPKGAEGDWYQEAFQAF